MDTAKFQRFSSSVLETLWPTRRTPMTSSNVLPVAGPPLILYLFLCYLVQRPKTQRIRLLMLPVVVPWLWYITFWVQWAPPRTMAINVPFTTTGMLFVLRAFEYCIARNGPRKITAMEPENVNSDKYNERTFTSFDKGLSAMNELFQSHRGIGWDFGTGAGLRLPPMQAERAAYDRRKWLRLTLLRGIIINYLVVDVINTWWRTIPEISDPMDPDKHFARLSHPLRYAVPSSVFVVVAAYMSMWYNAVAIIDVAVFGSLPASWPVLFGRPWKAESLHSLWAVEWHQLSRHTFLWPLGYSLGAVFGTPGIAFGAFLASGLYHNLMLVGDGLRQIDVPTNGFFFAQAVGVVLERWYRQVTGRKVGGRLGNLWTLGYVVLTVQSLAAVWINRGYLETSPIPRDFSFIEYASRALTVLFNM